MMLDATSSRRPVQRGHRDSSVPRHRRVVSGGVRCALSLAVAIGTAACQAPPDCEAQPGDVTVLRGGTFPLDAAGTIRAGLQYEIRKEPRTWKVAFLAEGGSISYDLARGDTVEIAGRSITVRDACTDALVLTLNPSEVTS